MVELNTEVVLIIINYRKADGLLVIYPDFNNIQSNPYILEIDADTKQMYHFGFEDISTKIKRTYKPKPIQNSEYKLLELERQMSHLSLPSETTFQHAFLLFQIIDARGFEYDNIHVKFDVGIPPTTEVLDGLLHASTHSSYKKRELWNFGYCHEIGLECMNGFRIDDFIDLNFEVISIDDWKRERMEGYTTLRVPIQPGYTEKHELNCYRIVTGSFLDSLRRYFIGDRYFQEDMDTKRTIHVSTHSRYGIQTVSTGTLRVIVYLLVQNKAGKIVLTEFE